MKILLLFLLFILGCDSDSSTQPPDECGIINGPGAIYECGCTEILEGECDCDGNVEDCSDVCGGNAEYDECGLCGGTGIDDDGDEVCDDEDDCVGEFDICGVCNGSGINECGECGAGGFNINGCIDCVSDTAPIGCCDSSSIPNNSFTILQTGELIYNSDFQIAGIQLIFEQNNFSINNINEIITTFPEYNFTVEYSEQTILAFSFSRFLPPASLV